MRFEYKRAAALVALAAAAGAAQTAHATEGWYGRADVGYGFGSEVNFDGDINYDLKDGYVGAFALGYGFTNGLRLDAEYAFHQNTGPGYPFVGHVKSSSVMMNLFYDFNHKGRWQPYVGAGFGYADLSFNDIPPPVQMDNGWAWQAMAGLGYALTDRLTLEAGYRYFAIPKRDVYEGGPAGQGEYHQQSAILGLRYQFASHKAAPPAPPAPPVEAAPAVQVCPAQDFKVYFEWDRSNLNAAATDTINAAAERAKACNVSTVKVVGYTDTSGSPKYNLALSNRRAAVVRDALVAAGIPATLIATEGLGETNLDKPTKDGVREPLNRRTAVTISFQ